MKRTFLITISLVIFYCTFSQTANITHTKLDQITFENTAQKELFSKQTLTYEEALKAALASGGISSQIEQNRLISALEKFANQEIKPLYKAKKQAKSLVKIQQKINANYFKAYSDAALMSDALFAGEFNCVTNAMINAYLLEKAGVDFTIEGDGNCFFLKSGQGNPTFGVEGIDQEPIEGNKTFYNNFAEMILGLKILTNEKFLTSTPQELYEEYNDEPEYLDAKALLAVHHILLADQKIKSEEYKEAYNHTKIANFLYPAYSTQSYTLYYGGVAVDNQAKYTLEGLEILSELHHFNDRYISHEAFVNQAIKLYEDLDKKTFRIAYTTLLNLNIQDSTLRNINWYIADQTSLDFYNRALLDSAYMYAKEAYDNSPHDLENQNLFYNRFIATYTRKSISSLEDEAQRLFTGYPEFMSNPYFRTLRQNLVLVEASDKIDRNKYSEAESLLKRFEKLEKEDNGDLKPEAVNIIKTYGRLAIFYFSTNNEAKALEMIEKALSIYPDDRDLLRKKSMIQSY